MPKTLVLYVFHQYNERVKRFIDNCIFYDENVDFIMISNNNKDSFYAPPSYVKVLFRENIGFDFGGWSDALLTDNLYQQYDNFIFVNSSVVGPFLPPNFTGKWTDIYLNGLKDNVKLFGSTINMNDNPLHGSHVQSYIFATDKEALQYLINYRIFSKTNYANTFGDAIFGKEVAMSRLILQNNWNIGSLYKDFKDIDFTFCNKRPEEYTFQHINDVMYPKFRNVLWNEYDLVFVKGNRITDLRERRSEART